MPTPYSERLTYFQDRTARFRTVMDGLKDQPCMDCGGRFPPECMDFDHVRGEKKANLAKLTYYPLDVILAEVEKCDLVCANCHRIRTRARGWQGAGRPKVTPEEEIEHDVQ